MSLHCLLAFEVRDKAGGMLFWNVSLVESDLRLLLTELISHADEISRTDDIRRSASSYIQAGGEVKVCLAVFVFIISCMIRYQMIILQAYFKKEGKIFSMGDISIYNLAKLTFNSQVELTFKIFLEDKTIDSVQRESEISAPEVISTNAFSIIMSTSQATRRKGFPDHYKTPKTGKEKLHNAMIEVWRDEENLSFKSLSELTVDNNWKQLKDLLWDLNKYRPTFPGLDYESKEFLDRFLGFSHYDDRVKSKKNRPPLRNETLKHWEAQLATLVKSEFAGLGMKMFFESLKTAIQRKQEVNERDTRRVNDNRLLNKHKAEWKTVSLCQASSNEVETLLIKPSIWGDIPNRYHSLNKALTEADVFEPIVVAEHMEPNTLIKRDNRYNFVNNIKSESRSIVVKVKHKGKQQSEIWIFKTGSDREFLESSVYMNLFFQTVDKCQKQSRIYVQSWIKRAFACRLASLYPTEGGRLLTKVCLSFLGDASSVASEAAEFSENKKGMVEIALRTGDSSLIEDARKLNGRPMNSAFKSFWVMTESYLMEVAQAAEARRKGDKEVGYMSEILSLRHMHETITNRLKENLGDEFSEDLVPSRHLLHLQFLPSNSRLLRSGCYTGRFNVQRKIQRRILHLDHVDAHYGNKLLQYMRSFALRYNGNCMFISADDKARIQIGRPGQPLQTGVRNKPTLAPDGVELYCLDHDYAGTSLVPSVYLIHKLPLTDNGNWYPGYVSVGIKDGIFEPSCPWRHAEELCRRYEGQIEYEKAKVRDAQALDPLSQVVETSASLDEHSNPATGEDINYPILLLLTDGGPDRNVKRASVLVAMMSVFLRLDLDMLVATRTVPHLSYRNPVERVMSLLNIALQNCAFCRERNDDLEELLKGCNTMKDIRKRAAEFHPTESGASIPEMFKASMKRCQQIIENRMRQLSWTDEPVSIYTASDSSEISALVDLFLSLDGHFSQDFKKKCRDTPEEPIDKKELYMSEVVKEFVEHHVRFSPYVLQIKKVVGCECTCCRRGIVKSPRLPPSIFDDLKWMPLPLVEESTDGGEVQKYKEFRDLYGSEPNPKDQPSLKTSKTNNKSGSGTKNAKLYNSNKARAFIQCSACSKARVIYVPKENECLTKREKIVIRVLEEAGEYVCGAQLTQYIHFESQREQNKISSDESLIVDLTDEQRTEQDKEFQFYLKENLTCETPMEEAYFKGQRLYHKRNKNICSHCGLSDNHIQQPTQQELKDYSSVFHPCIACKNSPNINPKTIYGSKRRKRREIWNDIGADSSEGTSTKRAAVQRQASALEDSEKDAETEPSGIFSEYSD